MYEQLLESSEFYQKRYHNFASKIILPLFGLILFIAVFFCFMKKEMTVKTSATVEPIRVLTHIQSTSNNKIKTNNLKENHLVKAGDLLVEYESLAESVQQETVLAQFNQLKEQKKQLELLKASFENGTSQFPAVDNFGYLQRFEDYLSQQETISKTINQQNSTIASQNSSSANAQGAIGEIIGAMSQKMADYQTLRSAIEHGSAVDASNSGYAVYSLYTSQFNVLTEETEKNTLKLQTMSQIDSQIQQFNTELANYRIQYSGSGTQQAYNTSLDSQLASLRSQKMMEVSQELTALEQKLVELEGNTKLQQASLHQTKLTATEDGIVHLNKEVTDAQLIPSGTLIASLYPLLETEKKVKIEAYIPSKAISSLAVGDEVKFKIQDSSNQEISLRSTISRIDTKATKTELGNFFKITAEVEISEQQTQVLKYGMEGSLVVVTGEKTYLNYYLDKFLN